jgi:alpha-beta hydrolase superfamily lysophospholipase
MDRLVEVGISIWAMDHRGHGRSEGQRGHIDSMAQYLHDLKKMTEIAKTGIAARMKFFLLGHSLGGLMVLNLVENFPDIADGMIASSPGLRPKIKIPVIKGTVAKLLSRILPSLTFDNELDSSALSHDPNIVAAYDDDPLVHRKITARWFTEFLRAMEFTRTSGDCIRIPILMQVAGDDRLVDAQTSRNFFESLPVKDKTLYFYDHLFHEIFNETTHERESVLKDLENWLKDHIQTPPRDERLS